MKTFTFTSENLNQHNISCTHPFLVKITVRLNEGITKTLNAYLKTQIDYLSAFKNVEDFNLKLGILNQTDKTYAIRFNESYAKACEKLSKVSSLLEEKEKAVKLSIVKAAQKEGQFADVSKELLEDCFASKKKEALPLP